MYVFEFHEEFFDTTPKVIASSVPQGWRIFAECGEDDIGTCHVINIVGPWSPRDFSDFVLLLNVFCRCVASGLPLQSLYDVKKLHEVAEVDIIRKKKQPAKLKIWQVRKENVRFLFFYGEGTKIIIAGHAFVKRGDKTPPGAIAAAQKSAQSYFSALDALAINTITCQGSNHEFSTAHQRTR